MSYVRIQFGQNLSKTMALLFGFIIGTFASYAAVTNPSLTIGAIMASFLALVFYAVLQRGLVVWAFITAFAAIAGQMLAQSIIPDPKAIVQLGMGFASLVLFTLLYVVFFTPTYKVINLPKAKIGQPERVELPSGFEPEADETAEEIEPDALQTDKYPNLAAQQ